MFPYIGIAVLSETFIIKSIHLGDLTAFVVSPENCDSVSVPDLQGHKESHRLQGVITSINIITHEQIVGFWALAPNSEKFGQVIELAMNVSANSNGCSYRLYIGLLLQDFFRLPCRFKKEEDDQRSKSDIEETKLPVGRNGGQIIPSKITFRLL